MSQSDYGDALPMRPIETEPPRTRRSTTVYTNTVRKFMDDGQQVQEIDLMAVDIKGQTLRVGLQKAIAELGVEDEVEFTIHESIGKAYLKRKQH